MKITDVIYEEEDKRDYLDYSTGRALFDLNDGSKAVTRFKTRIDRSHCDWWDVVIEQPKVPMLFISNKKRQWYKRVYKKLVDMTVNRVYADYVKEFNKEQKCKNKKDKIPPSRPRAGKPIKTNGI